MLYLIERPYAGETIEVAKSVRARATRRISFFRVSARVRNFGRLAPVSDRGGEDNTLAPAPADAACETPPLSDLYGRYRNELVAFVRKKFGQGPPEPEDIAQQAFLNFAAQSPGTLVANPRAFLYRTAANIALNHRKHDRVGRRFLEPEPATHEICEARPDWDPEVVLAGRQQYHLLEKAIRAMPPLRRQVLLLNRVEGLSYAEIARRLNRSESMVRKQVAAAIRECGAVLLAAEKRDGNGGRRS
jgi:RNA polymerase sigma factor (sigma-70 family)